MDFFVSLHPLIVHFPIAFFFLFLFLEFINLYFKNKEFENIAFFILLFAVLGGIISVLTGNQDFQTLANNSSITLVHSNFIELHEFYATLTLWYFVSILAAKYYLKFIKKNESRLQYLFIIFVVLGIYLLIKTANTGGYLVYEFGIGTNLLK